MHQTFHLIRHAESLGNAGVPDAGPNPGLSRLGQRQTRALAEHVAAQGHVAEIWSSPFARAVETACGIAEAADVRVRLEPGMHELFFPGWFDLATLRLPPLAEVARMHPCIYVDYDDDHWWPRVPEDEDALCRRLSYVAERLRAQASPGKTLLVGHGASVAALAHELAPEFNPLIAVADNASITEIEFHSGRCTLVRFNDTAHCARAAQGDNPWQSA